MRNKGKIAIAIAITPNPTEPLQKRSPDQYSRRCGVEELNDRRTGRCQADRFEESICITEVKFRKREGQCRKGGNDNPQRRGKNEPLSERDRSDVPRQVRANTAKQREPSRNDKGLPIWIKRRCVMPMAGEHITTAKETYFGDKKNGPEIEHVSRPSCVAQTLPVGYGRGLSSGLPLIPAIAGRLPMID